MSKWNAEQGHRLLLSEQMEQLHAQPVHCGRRVQAIRKLPVCSVRFVVNFKWPYLKQMEE